eukprot:PITA_10415
MGRSSQHMASTSSSNSTIKGEIGNMLEYFKKIQEINLRSGRILPDNQPPSPHRKVEEEREESNFKLNPPFPKRLAQPLQTTPKETKFLGELKNLCLKSPLLQAIKDVPYKLIKEKCFKHPGRRKRDAPTINFIRKLSDLMLGQVICPKYLDSRSPVVDVLINDTIITHTLNDLGVAINVMTKETMLKLNLQGSLRKITIVLQLANCSIVTPKGIVEDVMVSIDSLEYP